MGSMDKFDYDDYSDYEDDLEDYDYDDEDIFDCGWTGVENQVCDDIGSESCSFFCPHYRLMTGGLTKHPIPPRWAEEPTNDDIPF